MASVASSHGQLPTERPGGRAAKPASQAEHRQPPHRGVPHDAPRLPHGRCRRVPRTRGGGGRSAQEQMRLSSERVKQADERVTSLEQQLEQARRVQQAQQAQQAPKPDQDAAQRTWRSPTTRFSGRCCSPRSSSTRRAKRPSDEAQRSRLRVRGAGPQHRRRRRRARPGDDRGRRAEVCAKR